MRRGIMEDKYPLISIVIPVYCTQSYLQECMESVLMQDYPKLEIILVDDGSPDACPEMCDAYERKYKEVRVIHQKNSGLGMARNAGMDLAGGEYIFFLDSDDKLDGPAAVRKLAVCARKKRADIAVGGYRRFCGQEVSAVNVTHLRGREDTESVDFRFQGFYRYGHLAYNWGKLYRMDFLKEYKLRCKAYPFTQDKAHNMECCACGPVYAFLDESVCLYRIHEASVSFRYKKDMIPVWTAIAENFDRFCRQRGIAGDYGDLCAFHIFFGSFYLVKQELQEYGFQKAVQALRIYGRKPFVRKCMRQLARGKYVREIHTGSWRVMIRWAAVLFCMHGYFLYTAGAACLLRLHVDGWITKLRYRGSRPDRAVYRRLHRREKG